MNVIPPTTIERMPLMPPEEFYATPGLEERPIIFTGGMEHWPARQKWTFEWFKQTHGHIEAPVEWLKFGLKPDGWVERVGRVEVMKVRDYVEALLSPSRAGQGYLIGKDMLRLLPSLKDDIRFPAFQTSDKMTDRLFFMSPQGAFTQLHYDRAHNLHAMLVGRKRWQIWSPRYDQVLKQVPHEFVWSVQSVLDLLPHGGKWETFPANIAPEYDIVLEAGEMLYLPYGWWHRVLTVEPSIATNLWWWTWPLFVRRAPIVVPSVVAGNLLKRFKRYERHTAGRDYRS
ncbi:cupin-like domain-containing protein [Stigmatella aurantiaca]|uniref:Conserved uncharacterized protein n=1 Tax=Stigmatella aurantiaca (strain DW4/3-1) TaxID=378806 RepID=Q08TJ0_STIAD|nr:cupin-like domain-containing protein [Stigmatella aurantiaca]ADO71982.1 conserved uncharacterized protein [Stigmatella aurantiaca DW4/3-1]EAU63800.1 conserved hypothetical protein [Stigmatella aurantiaca DW4/3-1]